jgi:hypothetical protein
MNIKKTDDDVENDIQNARKLNGNFIHTEYLQNLKICDDVIKFFNEKNTVKKAGASGKNGKIIIDKNIKDSLDHVIDLSKMNPNSIVHQYLMQLKIVVDNYLLKYPFAHISHFSILESPVIQYYHPTGGYKEWHCERSTHMSPMSARHLVFMTYLNDVNDAGETEFLYQNLKVKPRKGLTVIWPADWTHFHRGVPSPTEEKYIVTGWLSFSNKM